jgi:hypothetical protein
MGALAGNAARRRLCHTVFAQGHKTGDRRRSIVQPRRIGLTKQPRRRVECQRFGATAPEPRESLGGKIVHHNYFSLLTGVGL